MSWNDNHRSNHLFSDVGFLIEEKHRSDEGGCCSYKGCARKYLIMFCYECGEERKIEIDMKQTTDYEIKKTT